MSEFTKQDLDLLEQRITANVLAGVLDKIEAAFDKQEQRLTALFDKDFDHIDKDFDHIKESLSQHKKWHEKQFDRLDGFDQKITDARMGIREEAIAGNDKQNAITAENTKAIAVNSDRLTTIESEARAKHGQIALIIAIIGTVGVLVWEIIQGMIG